MKGHIFTVSELNGYIKGQMDANPTLATVYLRGELSNYKLHSSGHHYMTIKDDSAVIRAVMFKFDATKLKFRPESGMKVIAKGRVSVFPRDGQYQLYISDMIPDGVGALYVAFEQLKRKLEEEGLFAAERKRQIPRFPATIALVTSPTGAAIRDMLRILKVRYPLAKIIVCPVLVQGADAPEDICSMLGYVNAHALAELIITGRGGGSIEDLWAFNDERVARAIAASKIPVISAVGHEPDVTIADFVADLRAATPSNAAELAVPDRAALSRSIKDYDIRISSALSSKLMIYREYLKNASEKPVMKSPLGYFQEKRMLIDFLAGKATAAAEKRIMQSRETFSRLAAMLDAMSPLKVLARGYAITSTADGKIVKKKSDVKSGDEVRVRVSDGKLDCVVK